MSFSLIKRVITLITLLVCTGGASLAQINRNGYANFKAYNAPTSSISATYLDITQDKRGIVFVASALFIMQYDGTTSELDNNMFNMYTIECEPSTGIVYTAGAWDFGFLEPDSKGLLTFHSLLNTLPEDINPEDIMVDDRIVFRNDSVFFMGAGTLIAYDRKSGRSESWPIPKTSRCVTMDNDIYTIKDHELCVVTRNGCIPQGTFFEKNIRFILDAERIRFDEYLLTCDYKVMSYNPYTKQTKDLNIDIISDALRDRQGQADKIQRLGNGLYAISNRGANKYGSVFVIDSTYNIVESFGKAAGARTNIAASMYMSSTDSILWVCGYDASSVDIKSPVRQFTHLSGFSGDLMDILFFDNGEPLILTTEGAFYRSHTRQGSMIFNVIPELESVQCIYGCRFIDPYTHKNCIVIATNKGVFSVDENYMATNIYSEGCDNIIQLSNDLKKLYITYRGELHSYELTRNNKLIMDTTFVIHDCDYIIHDSDSVLWIRDYSYRTKRLNVVSGEIIDLDSLGFTNMITFTHNRKELLSFTDEDNKGIYQFNNLTRKYEPCNLIKGVIDFENKLGITNIESFGKGYIVSTESEVLCFIYPDDSGNWQIQQIPGTIQQQATQFTFSPDSTLYFYSPLCVYTYKTDNNFKKLRSDVRKMETPYSTIIRKVTVGDDAIFNGNFKDELGGLSVIQPDSLIPSIEYSDKKISFNFTATTYIHEDLTRFSYKLEGLDENWSDWDYKKTAEYTNLFEGTYTFKVKSLNFDNVEGSVCEYTFVINPPYYRTTWAYILYVLLGIGLLWGYSRFNAFRLKRRNAILQHIIDERTRQIQQHEASMVSNINYASRIQKAALTPSSKISEIFPMNFVIYMPHSIVSGDFYIISEIDNKQVCVVADCTGHGVSGGFLSMLGISIIRQIISQTLDPAEILNQLRQYVISNLHQRNEAWSVQDGMDATVFVIDKETKRLSFSGANSKLLIVRRGEIFELRGDRMPVAIHFAYTNKKYTNSYFDLEPEDMVYAFTDGIIDQFGGEDNSKFMITRFKNLLSEIYDMGMSRQQEAITTTIEAYRGTHNQTDDILVIGVRIE